ncbi:protein abrupt isoform X1 [Drosophila albomicans]|uniref:Protein abrupt isoform X1 n=1 Tax=Drosophila albomicans TaxID=7291 RepID=A0A6P8XFS1_DROAB|nr:protein abrupt isoform X1 [Drosophila albomicans]
MTESTQLQTAENNNAGVVKMEPPPLATSTHSSHTLTHTHTHSLAATAAGGAGTALSPATPPLPLPPLGGHSSQQQQQQQHYALKWNDFQTSILSSFRHLRDEEDFVDVTLACDERSFTAHKVVLSACSPYFRKLLKANPCEHPIVILRDVRSDDVENLLSFMYNGEVNVSHEQLPDFLKTAHLLQIRGLADVNGGYPYSKALSAALSHSSSSSNNNNNNNNTADSSNHNKVSNYLPTALSNAGSNNNSSNGNNNNNSNNNNSSNNSNTHSQISPFNTPQTPSSLPVSSAAAAAAASLTAAVAAAAAATASSLPLGGNSQGQSQSGGGSGSGSSVTPAIQELKASAASPVRNSNPNPNPNPSKASSNHWDLSDMEGSRKSHLTPPPQKRIKSADLFRAQHGISPERLLIDRDFPVAGQHPLTRNRSRDTSKDRDRSLELRESLLGQALENSNGQQANQKHDLGQSAGEDSNSSDTEPSDRGDGQHDGTLDGMDNQRSHSFPNAFLGLQGIPGLLPGPSGLGGNDFVSRRSLEMRVRATDPRPCPKCGKIYRSAHTLRTHLEDKHTVCPGYRCVLCGTVAKSRNSLHSHMSRQHRGISTKDLPVLPMPSAFDPDLASRLLAKAGVKISPAELRARASPTGGSGSSGGAGNGGSGSQKLDLSNASGGMDDVEDSDDDPEDLTTGNGLYGSSASDLSRYHESLLSNFGHANTTISRMRNEAAAAAAVAALGQKDLSSGGGSGVVQMPNSSNAGQSLLDTYLQFITENTFGMGMSQEHAAAAALHAAKMAQLNAMGHNLDKLPAGLLPTQFDLSKLTGGGGSAAGYGQGGAGLTIEPILRRDQQQQPSSLSPDANGALALSTVGHMHANLIGGGGADDPDEVDIDADADAEIRRDGSEPMDLGLGLENNQSGSNNEVANSDAEENYSEDEGVHNT